MAIQLRARHKTGEAPASLDLARARAELDALLATGGDNAALLVALRRWLGGARAAIRAGFEADNDAEAAVRDHCGLMDALVHGLLEHALARVEIGDLDRPGTNNRPAGFVFHPQVQVPPVKR